MIKVLLLLLLPTFPYISAIHCRGQIMMSIITIHHHHHHCFSQSSSEMRVGGGFPLLTVRLHGGLNNKIKSMYQCKMYLDHNPCSPTIFFIKLPSSRAWRTLLVYTSVTPCLMHDSRSRKGTVFVPKHGKKTCQGTD